MEIIYREPVRLKSSRKYEKNISIELDIMFFEQTFKTFFQVCTAVWKRSPLSHANGAEVEILNAWFGGYSQFSSLTWLVRWLHCRPL